jgi:hypothetical protein
MLVGAIFATTIVGGSRGDKKKNDNTRLFGLGFFAERPRQANENIVVIGGRLFVFHSFFNHCLRFWTMNFGRLKYNSHSFKLIEEKWYVLVSNSPDFCYLKIVVTVSLRLMGLQVFFLLGGVVPPQKQFDNLPNQKMSVFIRLIYMCI